MLTLGSLCIQNLLVDLCFPMQLSQKYSSLSASSSTLKNLVKLYVRLQTSSCSFVRLCNLSGISNERS